MWIYYLILLPLFVINTFTQVARWTRVAEQEELQRRSTALSWSRRWPLSTYIKTAVSHGLASFLTLICRVRITPFNNQIMQRAIFTKHGKEPNPLDDTGLCLLSLDGGGGVRGGLSTLYILKSIMDRLNHERLVADLPRVKPCEVFDLI